MTIFQEKGITNTSAFVMMKCLASSTNCSTCKGCSAYSCSHVLFLNQELTSGNIALDTLYGLQIIVGVIGTNETYATSVFPSSTVMFTSKTTTLQTSAGLSAGEVVGIALGSVAVVGIGVGAAVAFKAFTRIKGLSLSITISYLK
ncbi:Hypothetical predicted protein [Mytilus galloprovincialis]|uniref:Uncharacterized protein n=1 Tax=Mytilus galloprovincialis TaxID=29158 RepID=A0A8B6C908_MYTGA|nr:Hypothetical predicted protein [Mytilus galloprovincialis]